MYELLWFLGGALLYKTFSKLLNLTHGVAFFEKAHVQSLKILGMATEDLIFIRAIKYIDLQKMDVDTEQIKKYKMLDEQALKQWKISTLNRLNSAVPEPLKGRYAHESWDAALRSLDEVFKKEK